MYGFDGAALDRWLTTDPREVSAAAEERYESWCEENDLNPEDDHWDAFEEAMYDAADNAAIEAAEAAREERDW